MSAGGPGPGPVTPDVFFRFESVVVVGASDDPRRIGGTPLFLLRKYGFAGRVYGLHPTLREAQGVPCFAKPEDLPEPVEMAIVCVGAGALRSLLPALAARGLKGAVLFSAGFAESGPDGVALQAWLTDFAAAHGIAILGPNCAGMASFAGGRVMTFTNPLMVFPRVEPGRVALLSQSGAVAINIWSEAMSGGVRFSHLITTGNEACLGFPDFLERLADDDTTDAVLGYVEGLRDGAAFCAAAARLRAKRKPLILLKVGSSAEGRDAVGSHTGQMTSDDSGYAAAFERHGVIRVPTLHDLDDHARVFAMPGLRPKLTAATTSGGAGVYVADLCAELAVPLSRLSLETERQLAEFVPSFGRLQNPVDLTGQVNNDITLVERSLRILLDDPETGVMLFMLAGKGTDEQAREAIALFRRVADSTSKTLVICWLGTPDTVRARAVEAGLTIYKDPVHFLRPFAARLRWEAGLAAADQEGAGTRLPALPALPADLADRLVAGSDGRIMLPESACLDLLDAAGIDTPRRLLADGPEALAAAARTMPRPCVMKLVEPALAHKSDAGGVALGLRDADALQAAWRDMVERLGARRVMLAEQIAGGVELLVGCVRDPVFGLRVTVGSGGIWTNALRDVVTLIPPVTPAHVSRQLTRLACWPALSGGRGQPPLAVDRLVDTIVRLAALAAALPPAVTELECNPVIVTRDRAVAVDAIGLG